ncbi:MAG: hypothetical protein FGM24_11430 [Candidatus Kapabacteria bacterium]|nr:hypothetical protein [Candidatus Kapabacteria bacterium]
MKAWITTLLVLGCMLAAWQTTTAQYKHPRHVISGAGGRMSSATAKLEGTLTQTAIGYVGGPDSTAHVGFWYPVVTTKETDSAVIIIALPDTKAKTGDIIDIPIIQQNSRWSTRNAPSTVSVSVAVNGSVLQPIDPTATCPPAGLCTLSVQARPLASDGVLAVMRCQVKLGDADMSPLHITGVTWPPNSRVHCIVRHGSLQVTDICREGDSTRLIIAGEATRLMPPRPSPAVAMIDGSYSLAGRTDVSLTIVDATGQVAQTVVALPQPAGSYTYRHDVSGLPVGQYFLVLRTDEAICMQPLAIAR